MAHLVEIYKGLSKVSKVKPFSACDFPKTLLDCYVENTVAYYEKVEARRLRRNSLHGAPSPSSPTESLAERVRRAREKRLRRRTLATIGENAEPSPTREQRL